MTDDRIGSGAPMSRGFRDPRRVTARHDSATRRPGVRGRRAGYANSSPLLWRAQPSSLGPAEMLPLVPSALFQSRDKVRGDRPASTVAMIAGQASSVESKRARILFEGISRSEYPTAPSMQISVFSPGLRRNRLGRAGMVKSISGMSRSSSVDVFMAFALRGAPCGDDPRPWTARRGYHDDHLVHSRVTDRPNSGLAERVPDIGTFLAPISGEHLGRFCERDTMFAQVRFRFCLIPFVPRHRETVATGPYPSLIPC